MENTFGWTGQEVVKLILEREEKSVIGGRDGSNEDVGQI